MKTLRLPGTWEFQPRRDERFPGMIGIIADADGGSLMLTRENAIAIRDWLAQLLDEETCPECGTPTGDDERGTPFDRAPWHWSCMQEMHERERLADEDDDGGAA